MLSTSYSTAYNRALQMIDAGSNKKDVLAFLATAAEEAAVRGAVATAHARAIWGNLDRR